ncbi:unnamed protein product [Diamesa serratosioi]
MAQSPDLEVRLLPMEYLLKLCQILEVMEIWKNLMRNIPKNVNDTTNREAKYTGEDVQKIEDESRKLGSKSSPQILFDEWSTSGKRENRPRMSNLLDILIRAELFTAADYVAGLIDKPFPQRPNDGPAKCVDLSLPSDECDTVAIAGIVEEFRYPFADTSNDPNKDNFGKRNDYNKVIGLPQSNPEQSISDLIKFSENSIDSQLPKLSILERRPSPTSKLSVPGTSSNITSNTNNESQSQNANQIVTASDSSEIPDLSVLGTKLNNQNYEPLPFLSELGTRSSIEKSAFQLPDITELSPRISTSSIANMPLISFTSRSSISMSNNQSQYLPSFSALNTNNDSTVASSSRKASNTQSYDDTDDDDTSKL